MPTAAEFDAIIKILGPVGGSLFLFVFGLKMEWWYMATQYHAALSSKDEILRQKDEIIRIKDSELQRERELSSQAVLEVKETVDWAFRNAKEMGRR